MPFKTMKNQCKATSKTTGQRCPNPSVTGYDVCYHHGANPKNHGGGKKGNGTMWREKALAAALAFSG